MGNGTVRDVHRKDIRDYNTNRVRYLKAPGPNGQEIRTHAFHYYPDEKMAGHADVYDAENKRTRYIWNKDKRLTHIERYNTQNDLVMAQEFEWGTGKHKGFLVKATIYDEQYKPKLTRKLTYDSRGNILSDTLLGCFTKRGESDSLTTTYTYSKDRFNNKTSECDPTGNYTYYHYVKDTNLLKAKLICDKQKICKREFYRYDKSATLIETILDDGSSWDKKNLSAVTERHITRITPRKQRPHYGAPEVIEELCLDGRVKKTVNHFSEKGFVIKQELFDAENTLQATTHFDYDDIGRITYKQEPSGRIERYSYDSSGRLSKKVLPNTTYSYFYDVAGRLIREEEELPNTPTLITYYEYDNLGRKIKVIDPQNNETSYEYDALNRITKISYPALSTKHFSYEKLGTIQTETDENGYKTTRIYNALGKIFEEHFPDNTHRFCSYDKKGNLISEIAPNGTTQRMIYDAFNRLTSSKMISEDAILSEKTLSYNSFHLIEETSPTNEKLRFTYDSAGRKTNCFLNNRLKTTYHYDALGRLSKENNTHYSTKYSYDSSDRIIAEHIVDDAGKTHTYKLFDYDLDGNCTEESHAAGTTKTEFYAHSLPAKRIDALGNTWYYNYDYYYPNSHGQRVCKKIAIDPRGVSEEEIFDTHGNLSQLLRFDPMGVLLSKKELFYDGAGNCTCTLEYALPTSTVIKTLFFYGPNNRLEKIIEAADTPEAKTTSYIYNSYGQKECTLHADGTQLTTLYDKKGRVEHFYAHDNSLSYTYSYDASDKILTVTNNLTNQKTLRSYNDAGELTSETLESGLCLQYSYDNADRLTTLTLPDSSSVRYDYSPVHLSSITRNDWKHIVTERDLTGKSIAVQLPKNGGTMQIEHDALLRTTALKSAHFTQENTEYDAIGNLLKQKTSDAIGPSESTYTYDFLSQLTHESGHITHDYSYNALHDRLARDDTAYSVNSLHSVLSDGTKEYRYDSRGNRTHDDKSYHYDALDRLIKVELPDKSYYTYSYDAFDRRLDTTSYSPDGTEISHIRYLYALENEIGAVDDSGTITELRILGEGLGAEIGASVGIELQDKLFIPLHDTRGNITCLLDTSGNVVESYRYDAFGNETIYNAHGTLCQTSPVNNPWRFSSKRTDSETGLVYFGRRYYDPTLGTWLTTDPLGLKAGPNLYAYVLNNPMTHFDLYGLLDENEVRDITTEDRGFWSDVWDRIKDWGSSVSSFVGDTVKESIKDDLRGDFIYDILERTIPGNRSQDPGATPDALNPLYGEFGEIDDDLSEIFSGYAYDWAFNALLRRMAKHGKRPSNSNPKKSGCKRDAQSTMAQKKSPEIQPNEIAGKTPSEIHKIALEKGLIPKGVPETGKGAYIDPVTGKQRILTHPNPGNNSEPHCHVNTSNGERLNIHGNIVPPESPEAHLPLKKYRK